jgi:copper chaperone
MENWQMCTCNQHASTETPAAVVNGVTFKVEDMTCAHCAGTIRNALKEAMPHAAVSIDIDSQEVTVGGDPEAAAAVIREAGYEPKVLAH